MGPANGADFTDRGAVTAPTQPAGFGDKPKRTFLAMDGRLRPTPAALQDFYAKDCFGEPPKPTCEPRARAGRSVVLYLEASSFGAREATIFSKRGSPRSGSQ